MRIKTITYSDVLAKALPVLLARTFAHRYSKFQPLAWLKIDPHINSLSFFNA
jgi:hypothetical protein